MIFKSIVFTFIVAGVLADSFEDAISLERDDLKEVFQSICKQNGAEDKVDQVVNATIAYLECLNGIVDFNTIDSNQTTDDFIKKYCNNTSQLKTCLHMAVDGMSPCLNETYLDITGNKNGADRLIDFMCYNDGERISMFIADGGPKCFVDKWSPISTCISKLNEPVSSDESKNMTVAEKCAKFDEASACISNALKGCTEPNTSSSSFYESLISSYRKGTPCDTALPSH